MCREVNSTLGEMLDVGDFGIGTFNGSGAGEMILMAGIPYSFPEPNRSVPINDPSLKLQFAMVTRFQKEGTVTLRDLPNFRKFGIELDRNLRRHAPNYAVLLRGQFSHLTFGCADPSVEGKIPFDLIPRKSRTLHHVEATLIGFRIAAGLDPAISKPGYHFHGIATDAVGGHVMEMGVLEARADIQRLGPARVLNP